MLRAYVETERLWFAGGSISRMAQPVSKNSWKIHVIRILMKSNCQLCLEGLGRLGKLGVTSVKFLSIISRLG